MSDSNENPSPRRGSSSKVSDRLLTPTAATANGKYVKPAAESDPRESSWQPNASKSSPKAAVGSPETNTVEAKASPKVKATSSRLLTPTQGNEHAKYKAPDIITPIKTSPKANVAVSSRLLTPTKANENGVKSKYKSPGQESPPAKPPTPKSPMAVTSRLLTPTKATTNGMYKKPEEVAPVV